jgi:hypothetical protein
MEQILEILTGFQLVKKFPTFYGTQRFITAIKSARTCPYPEPARSRPYPHFLLPEDPSIYVSIVFLMKHKLKFQSN